MLLSDKQAVGRNSERFRYRTSHTTAFGGTALRSALRVAAISTLLVLSFFGATTLSAQSFRLVTNGPIGEYVSGGQPRLFVSPARNSFPGVLDRSAPIGTDYFTYVAQYVDGGFFSFTVGTDGLGINLRRGNFGNAQRAPFATSGHPGLDVVMLGNGCNEVAGSFIVHSVRMTAAQDVDAIDVSFTQLCEGREPALIGRFTYDASGLPIPSLSPYEIEQPKVVPTLGWEGKTLLTIGLLLLGLASSRMHTPNSE